MTPRPPHSKGGQTPARIPWTTCWALGCIALLLLLLTSYRLQHILGHESTHVWMQYQATTNCSSACSSQRYGANNPDAAAVLARYFPQYQQQCGNSSWRHRYAQLHHHITSGQVPPRYLISVAVQAGMGDRITGGGGLHMPFTACSCLTRSRGIGGASTWQCDAFLCVISRVSHTILPCSPVQARPDNGDIWGPTAI
jgi:hypothetical protein